MELAGLLYGPKFDTESDGRTELVSVAMDSGSSNPAGGLEKGERNAAGGLMGLAKEYSV
jgi:hypothetical protein